MANRWSEGKDSSTVDVVSGEAREDAVIEVRGMRMRYGSVDVLKRVDFTARRGEVLALLGPNGAGKTTTIEILEGFRMRSAGEVRVLETDPAKGDERWRARLGIVLQSWRDHGKWRVRELLDNLGRYYAPYSTPERRCPYDADDLGLAVPSAPALVLERNAWAAGSAAAVLGCAQFGLGAVVFPLVALLGLRGDLAMGAAIAVGATAGLLLLSVVVLPVLRAELCAAVLPPRLPDQGDPEDAG